MKVVVGEIDHHIILCRVVMMSDEAELTIEIAFAQYNGRITKLVVLWLITSLGFVFGSMQQECLQPSLALCRFIWLAVK